MKWEYRIVSYDIREVTSPTEDYFNEMGQEEWECFAVTERAAFFKRKAVFQEKGWMLFRGISEEEIESGKYHPKYMEFVNE